MAIFYPNTLKNLKLLMKLTNKINFLYFSDICLIKNFSYLLFFIFIMIVTNYIYDNYYNYKVIV